MYKKNMKSKSRWEYSLFTVFRANLSRWKIGLRFFGWHPNDIYECVKINERKREYFAKIKSDIRIFYMVCLVPCACMYYKLLLFLALHFAKCRIIFIRLTSYKRTLTWITIAYDAAVSASRFQISIERSLIYFVVHFCFSLRLFAAFVLISSLIQG